MNWFQKWSQKLSASIRWKNMSTLIFKIQKIKVDYMCGKKERLKRRPTKAESKKSFQENIVRKNVISASERWKQVKAPKWPQRILNKDF